MFFKIVSIIGSLTLVSRILGYVRDLLIARFLGAGLISDAFLFHLNYKSLQGFLLKGHLTQHLFL